VNDQALTATRAAPVDVGVKSGRANAGLEAPEEFEVDAANLEGPPDEGERRVELRCELRTGTKVQLSMHRPDPDGPVLAQLCGSPIPSNLTIRELRALSLLIEQAIEAGDDL